MRTFWKNKSRNSDLISTSNNSKKNKTGKDSWERFLNRLLNALKSIDKCTSKLGYRSSLRWKFCYFSECLKSSQP